MIDRKRAITSGKGLIIAALVGAVGFGAFMGYLAFTSDSFPAQQRPFADYATVVSSTFNGTEYAFRVQWKSSEFIPMYVQLTSQATDSANSPVCDLNVGTPTAGLVMFMPFGLSRPSTSIGNADLSIAVKTAADGSQFTVVYHANGTDAVPGDILPSNLSCTETAAPM